MSPILQLRQNFFSSRNDPADPRLGDYFLKSKSSSLENKFIVMGYPDDQGIFINGGRTGSSLAPEHIRRQFYKMTPTKKHHPETLMDWGDFQWKQESLQEKQQQIQEVQIPIYQQSGKIIALGGGHDFAAADTISFLKHFENQNPIIVNFDAHADVRTTALKGPHSGTPFYQMLENPISEKCTFIEMGLQSVCNSKDHFDYLRKKRAHVFSREDFRNTPVLISRLSEILFPESPTGHEKTRPCFLSIDMDVFSQEIAPGCSQSWPHGILWNEFEPIFHWLCHATKVCGLGIYEANPLYDMDFRTSKLAAVILHEISTRTGRSS